MNETQNLSSGDAVKKIRELVEAGPTCMFASQLTSIPIHVCPMQAQQVDDHGNLWFFSGADSDHNAHVKADPRVQLLFSNPGSYEYLTIFGEAEINRDAAKIDELWNKIAEAWFPGGKGDPNLRLIRVCPSDAHYWATKDGKVVSMVKILAASLTGKMADVGVSGALNV
jgi:general stress protein 26